VSTPRAGDLAPVGHAVLRSALQHGANQASVAVSETQALELEWRDGRLEKIQRAQSSTMSLRLFVDGRYSSHQTSDLRPEALEAVVIQAIPMTRYLSADPHRGLPEPELCMPLVGTDVDLVDPGWSTLTYEYKVGTAGALEDASRSVDHGADIVTVTTSWSDAYTRLAMVDSQGFQGVADGTMFWLGSSVTVRGEGDKRPQGWHWVGGRRLADLPVATEVGAQATVRALDRVGARKIPTGRYNVLVENRAAGRLIGSLAAALSGAAVQQDASFLCGRLGAGVAASRLTMWEEPLVPRGLGTRLFDAEGMAARRFPLVEAGVLKSYYLDTYYARKLGMPPTTGSSANLSFGLGSRSLGEMLSGLREGVLITGFLGGNSNGTTGDFSFGVMGFYVKSGERAFPIGEVNLAGNHRDFWHTLGQIGNDPYPYSSRYCPSMLFENVQLTGS
jgi:PmbA protein